MKKELSIIIPFINEYPQIVFTVRAIAEEFLNRVNFEIICVDNHDPKYCRRPADRSVASLNAESAIEDFNKWSDEGFNCFKELGEVEPADKGFEHLGNVAKGNKWLRVIEFKDKKSHWGAKRAGVEASEGKHLLFVDAHTSPARDALYSAFLFYDFNHNCLGGTLHMPLTYLILEWRRLIYSLRHDLSKAIVDYKFCSYRENEVPYEVPCMSTCGMFISRKIYDDIGGFPEALGIYSGGEHFMNFTLAVTGYKKYIMPGRPLYHHGEKRGYSWNYGDFVRNRAIATYMFGGAEMCRLMCRSARGRKDALEGIGEEVIKTCKPQRDLIKSKQKMTIQEWLAVQDEKKRTENSG